MKIVIAPDSFKESLTALEVANAIERGFKRIFPNAEYVKLPMADGGEGTVQSLVDATQGRLIEAEVTAPLGNQVKSFFGLSGDGKTAIIEMAAASGLHLVLLHLVEVELHIGGIGTAAVLVRHFLDFYGLACHKIGRAHV